MSTMLLFFAIFCVFVSVSGFSPRVKTETGKLVGTIYTLRNGRVIYGFLGIPYALPPVGYNRFEAPKPVKYWKGVKNATFPRNECAQFLHVLGSDDHFTGDEDCLHLNVFTPKLLKKRGRRNLMNVIVYIHGGGFMTGSGRKTNPDYLLQNNDIVYVSINYRLGIFGTQSNSTNDLIAPGNYGLKDQVMALRWVQQNIRHFGGDPGKVTIYGASAGASSVQYHFISPLSHGLFQNGISASGSILLPWTLPRNGVKNSIEVASFLNCPTHDKQRMMRCLKRKSVEEIFKATKKFSKWRSVIEIPFGPVVEPRSRLAFLSKNPLSLLKNGEVKNLPWMISIADTEGSAPGKRIITNAEYLKEFNENWEEIAPGILFYDYIRSKPEKEYVSAKLRKFYFENEAISNQTTKQLYQVLGDRWFNNGIMESTKLHNAAIYANTFCYKFKYRGSESIFCDDAEDKIYGTCHCDDQLYLVKSKERKHELTRQDRNMMKFLTSSIVSFMKNGNPNTGSAKWQPMVKSGSRINCLNIYSPKLQKMENIENLETIQFWKDLLPYEYSENFV